VDKKKFLVIDDSKLIHKMFNVMLRQYEVVHAMDGREGLVVASQHPDIHAILLDINMPNMNGMEFLTKVKADSALAEIPVVIISTEGKEEDTVRAMEAGASAYIKKPFDHKQLLDVIAEL
jgi:two-component system, chemotaxis family, chemotaxis protein CheY